jgi:hypothetical protein
MINYEVRVTSKGAFIWGADSFNTDIVNEGRAELVVRNSEFGETVKLFKEPSVGGTGGMFIKLAPGETVSFSLKGCTGIKAACTVDHADSQIQCFLAYPCNS